MSHRKIPILSLVFLIVAAIDSIRNLPSPALFGASLIFFFAFAAILFLIPTALVAAELSATFPEKGGVYHWVKTAFGEKLAMLAIWLQWINTMVWFPTILSFLAATATYLIDPSLIEHKGVLIGCILVVFWGVTLLNLRGVHFSVKLNTICAVFGLILPMLFLIVLGVIWVCRGEPLQISLSADTIFPSFSHGENWISLVAIMASFLGMELAGVHVNDIKDPQRNFPKAVLYAVLFLLVSMLLGSLTIAFVLPASEINLVAGVIQVLQNLLGSFGLASLTPVFAGLIVIGTLGQITSYLISPAKGLMHAAEFGYLPRLFTKQNKHGVAPFILIGQAIVVSLVCSCFLFVPTVNAFYWFLTALSTELYMLMYLLMFLSALYLHHKYRNRPKVFKIPGKHVGMWITCVVGMCGCLITVVVSFIPPDILLIASIKKYATMIALGNLISIAPVFGFFLFKFLKKSS